MRKIIFTAALILGATMISFAQTDKTGKEVLNKKGESILPAKGDFGLSFDATPILRYTGNIFNNTTDNDFSTQGLNAGITGRYFLTDKSALRATVNLDFGTTPFKNIIISDEDPQAKVTDTKKVSNTEVALSLGYEWRRGYGRLQAFYGGQALITFDSQSTKYTYGNALEDAGGNTSTKWNTSNFDQAKLKTRALKETSGLSFGAGIGGFVGVEYFVLPHIAIGGELGIGMIGRTLPKGKQTSETIVSGKRKTENSEYYSKYTSNKGFHFTTNYNAVVSLSFYF